MDMRIIAAANHLPDLGSSQIGPSRRAVQSYGVEGFVSASPTETTINTGRRTNHEHHYQHQRPRPALPHRLRA